jgi:hypothetical protein
MTPDRSPQDPSYAEMLGEVVSLSVGFVVALLPLLLTAVPGLVLLLFLPAVLLLAVAALPLVLAAVLLGPPVLLVRSLRRRRAQASGVRGA